MRPRATRQTDWAQLGIGACVLLLPPLALGAALYSMLAPDDGTTRPAEAGAALSGDGGQPVPPATGLPATASDARVAVPRPAGPFADGRARSDQAVPPGMPIQVPAVPVVAVNPPAFAESAATAAAPKRSINRNAQRQSQQPPQQDPVRTFLQRIGLLAPYR